jgi:hypothetical protein
MHDVDAPYHDSIRAKLVSSTVIIYISFLDFCEIKMEVERLYPISTQSSPSRVLCCFDSNAHTIYGISDSNNQAIF